MDKQKILEDFDIIQKSKKQSNTILKLVLFFSFSISIVAIVLSLLTITKAMNKIIVVDSGGLYLKTIVENREQLQTTLILNTCSMLITNINSFDRNSIIDNQANAYYYCSKNELKPIFEKYKQEKIYQNVLDRGVIYKCEMEQVPFISKSEEPIEVKFSSILTEYDGTFITKYRIISTGKIISVKPEYPKNITGYFFSEYRQEIQNYIDNGEEN